MTREILFEQTLVSGTASKMSISIAKVTAAKESSVPDMSNGELTKTGDTWLTAIKPIQKAALQREVMKPDNTMLKSELTPLVV